MKSKFNLASFFSLGLLFSFLVMFFSGVILYIAPEGSISRWMGWDVLGLSKKQWEHQHTIFSYVFTLFAVFHIFLINWQLMFSYLKAWQLKFIYIREFILVILITIVVFCGTLFYTQPFKWVINLGNNTSENIGNKVIRPTVSDPEKLTMDEFARDVLQISYDSLSIILNLEGLNGIEKETTFEVFCNKNRIVPEDLYKRLIANYFYSDDVI